MNKSEGYCPPSYLQEISKNGIQIWKWSFTLKYSEICQISEMELFAKIVLRPAFSCIRTECTSYTGKYGSQKALVFWHILRNMRAKFWNICKSSGAEVFCKITCSKKISNIFRKKALWSLYFDEFPGSTHKCFPENLADFLGTLFYQSPVNDCFWNQSPSVPQILSGPLQTSKLKIFQQQLTGKSH